ncbi:hypothetical protein B2J93_1921 [Marssonina coronariae]|uniref:Uncharacterized protein n=1 Tax=Diplocarpon coronariae TaxID=2795749 RepID=A0A218YWR5_9HELO|nr:hypothetical protein B2J93_1921 [Marssonina coronariae]
MAQRLGYHRNIGAMAINVCEREAPPFLGAKTKRSTDGMEDTS